MCITHRINRLYIKETPYHADVIKSGLAGAQIHAINSLHDNDALYLGFTRTALPAYIINAADVDHYIISQEDLTTNTQMALKCASLEISSGKLFRNAYPSNLDALITHAKQLLQTYSIHEIMG